TKQAIDAQVIGSWVQIGNDAVANDSATVDFTDLRTSEFDDYALEITGLVPVTDDTYPILRVGTGDPATLQSSNYQTSLSGYDYAGEPRFSGNGPTAGGLLLAHQTASYAVGNATGENYNATIRFSNLDASIR